MLGPDSAGSRGLDRSLTRAGFADYACTSMAQQKAQWDTSAIKLKKRFSGPLVRMRSGARA